MAHGIKRTYSRRDASYQSKHLRQASKSSTAWNSPQVSQPSKHDGLESSPKRHKPTPAYVKEPENIAPRSHQLSPSPSSPPKNPPKKLFPIFLRQSQKDTHPTPPATSSPAPSSSSPLNYAETNYLPRQTPTTQPSPGLPPRPRSSPPQPPTEQPPAARRASSIPLLRRQNPLLPSTPAKPLRQLTLSLGQSTTTTCPICHLTYTPSLPSDVTLHATHHRTHLSPPELTLSPVMISTLCSENRIRMPQPKPTDDGAATHTFPLQHPSEDDIIVCITRRSTLKIRRAIERILDIVERDLGGVGIPRERLWSMITLPGRSTRDAKPESGEQTERYRVYLYLRRRDVVGVLLGERISSARRVVSSSSPPRQAHPITAPPTMTTPNAAASAVAVPSGSITASAALYPAALGVSRIWTAARARGQGVATRLLDGVVGNFVPGRRVEKELVAFSAPTERGAGLARRWCGREVGWGVYDG